MRTRTAAQKGGSGGWHYVSLHPRHGGHPIGYCAEHEPHETELEARECFSQYQRDRVRLDVVLGDWTGCTAEGCDAPTRKAAQIWGDGFALAPLCDDHLRHGAAVKALHIEGPAGDAWVS